MTLTDLGVVSEEQTITLQDGYSAVVRFDLIYKRWFYDLYRANELVYAGVALTPDTAPLNNISDVSLCLIDLVRDKEQYEPYSELGGRLALMELADVS